MRTWQYADYFEGQRDRAFQRLLVSLKRRADSLDLQNNLGQSADISDQTKNNIEESNEQVSLLESVSISSQEQKDKIAQFEAFAVKQGVLRKKVNKAPNKITLSNGMEFMHVPAGEFLMGSTKDNKFGIFSINGGSHKTHTATSAKKAAYRGFPPTFGVSFKKPKGSYPELLR